MRAMVVRRMVRGIVGRARACGSWKVTRRAVFAHPTPVPLAHQAANAHLASGRARARRSSRPIRMFHIDLSDPTPVEAQLVRTIRSAIGAGVLAAGDVLPTVRQLAVDLRSGANAVGRAYAELEEQRVLANQPGVGTV